MNAAIEPQVPNNITAEQAVIGSCVVDRDAVIAIAPWLKPDHFYLEKHRAIYEAVLRLYDQRIPPDLITIKDELRKVSKLEEVGDVAYLVECAMACPTSLHVEYYGRIVEHAALGRNVIQAGGRISSLGYKSDLEGDELVGNALEMLQTATQRTTTTHQPAGASIDVLLERVASQRTPGHPTGLIDLDRTIGGLQRRYLMILAARPGVGKSSLALQLAYKVARDGGLVLMFSYEMDRDEINQRLLAMLTGIDLDAISQNRVTAEQLVPLMEKAEHIKTLPFEIDDAGSASITDIRNEALRVQAERGDIALVVVDYLQLVPVPRRREGNRANEVAEISRGLKQLAMTLNCPVLALSQLNRSPEGRQSHKPMLSDLRESGAIEQDANQVIFIYREEMYNADTDKKGMAELIIAKNRQGPLGIVPVRYDQRNQRWMSGTYQTPQGY